MLAELLLSVAVAGVRAPANTAPTRCDVLAASEAVRHPRAAPVPDAKVDIGAARDACREDLARDPGNPRLVALLKRVDALSARGQAAGRPSPREQ